MIRALVGIEATCPVNRTLERGVSFRIAKSHSKANTTRMTHKVWVEAPICVADISWNLQFIGIFGGVAIGAGEKRTHVTKIVVKISAGQVFNILVYMFHHVSIVVQFPLYHPLLVAEIQPPWSPWS